MTANGSEVRSGDGADRDEEHRNGRPDAAPRTGPAVRRPSDWSAERLRGLAAEYGTPAYVIDLDRVRENVRRLQGAFDEESVSYAVKANTTRAVLETVADEGLGAECASAGEVQRAIDAGFDPSRVRYTAVNPPGRDLDHVVGLADEHDLIVTVGAADTLDRIAERGYDGRLYVRVNPGVGAGHHEGVTTGTDPTFGVPYDRAAEVVRDARSRGFDVEGTHAHAGSGFHSEEDLTAFRELAERMAALAREVGDLATVNVGGGLGVPYRPEKEPLDLEPIAESLRAVFADCEATVGIEPGRYVVADAGVLLTTVNTVKETPETLVVGADAGMTTLIRPALYGSYHEIRSLAPDAADRERRTATVAGPVCETTDVLATDRDLPAPERGDVLAVGTAGAYGYEMASQYNSRPRPPVIALADGDDRLAARRETIADVTRLEEQ